MGLFGFGKKKADAAPLNVKALLTEEELTLLVTEMRTVANRVPGETSAIMAATADTILEGGDIPAKAGLDLCIAALNMTDSFKESQPGNRELAKKLEAIRKG